MSCFDCSKCPDLVSSRYQIVFGKKYSNSNIFIIGEAPGKLEDEMGIPFIGKSGKILRKALFENNIHDYYITNIVKCRPKNNRDPNEYEINNCLVHLKRELLQNSPKIIFTVGRKSTEVIYNLFNIKFSNISENRGNIIKLKYNGADIKLLSTYHPASTIFNKNYRSLFFEDIKTLSNVAGI